MATQTPAQALTLQFDYRFDSANFFADPSRQSVLNAAGTYFSSLLTDSLTAITSSGQNLFTAEFLAPSTLQSTLIPNFSVAADTLVVFVGGNSTLGAGTLGQGGPGGYSAQGSPAFSEYGGDAGSKRTDHWSVGDGVRAMGWFRDLQFHRPVVFR